ncbi:hypothetical protein ACFX5Q_05790 [Mesorhizobium sp. IMUNJ 23033]|uniref:hypothetical protein n=1 Tax=Mesorhizobium sp. IMUNJ 23033 TaxID=3378039 RepID=UPI00384DF3DB
MPAGDPNFCATYTADPDVDKWIEEGNEEFYVRYKNWLDAGSPKEIDHMTYFFEDNKESKKKLEAGESPKVNGGIRQSDCKDFNDFVAGYVPIVLNRAALARADLHAIRSSDKDLLQFRAALFSYFVGDKLSDDEKRTINGTLFVQVDIQPIDAGGGEADKRLYAIPGNALVGFDRNLGDKRWKYVDEQITKALDSIRGNVINISGAVQLRLGGKGTVPIYEPITIGDGMVIMGRN